MHAVFGPMANWMDRPETPACVPSREFKGANGITWSVKEVARDGSRSLLFECAHVVRRVREFPEHWLSLSPLELEALSWRR